MKTTSNTLLHNTISDKSKLKTSADNTLTLPNDKFQTLPNWKTADDNFKFPENGRKFSKQVENMVGKGEIVRKEQFLLFPVFSKDLNCRHVKIKALKALSWNAVNAIQTWRNGHPPPYADQQLVRQHEKI